MADAPGGGKAAPKPSGQFTTLLFVLAIFYVMFTPSLRNLLGRFAGYVLDPTIGFDGRYPVMTLMLAGSIMVLLTTLIRHFTTDWLANAKSQAVMRHFQKEMVSARKENNLYKIKKLQDYQSEILSQTQAMQAAQMRVMPFTMIVVIPLFAWMSIFLDSLDYPWYAAPWNPQVDMFSNEGIIPIGGGTSLFPHWILLYTALSIPLGFLIQRAMKYLSWKERWQGRHPEVHEG